MQAIVNYFTDQEWHSSCENIAKFVASRDELIQSSSARKPWIVAASVGVVEALKDQRVCIYINKCDNGGGCMVHMKSCLQNNGVKKIISRNFLR
ncbi:hypothetical protein AHAS_Ahas05G0042500 [Arachis hypogaea]